MAKFRSGLCGAIALLATACLPVSASAATLPETLTASIQNVSGTLINPNTNAFNQFNPSLGTLTSISATLGGSFDWTVQQSSDVLRVDLFPPGRTSGLVLAEQTFDVTSTGTFTESLSLNAPTTSFASMLAEFEGTGTLKLSLLFEDNFGASINSADGLSGSITYTYTPAGTPLPATLPLFATGLGALGLLGWRRKRKA